MIINNMSCPNGYCRGSLFINSDDGEDVAECHLCGRSWSLSQLEEIRKQRKLTVEIKEKEQGGVMGQSKRVYHSKYDHLIPQITADLKTMKKAQVEKKYKIPRNTLGHHIVRWQQRELMPKTKHFSSPVPVKTEPKPLIKETKTSLIEPKPLFIEPKHPEPSSRGLIPEGIDLVSFATGYRMAVLDIMGAKNSKGVD